MFKIKYVVLYNKTFFVGLENLAPKKMLWVVVPPVQYDAAWKKSFFCQAQESISGPQCLKNNYNKL